MKHAHLKALRTLHAPLLQQAMSAIKSRNPFMPFSDDLSKYSSEAKLEGKRQFNQLLGRHFHVDPARERTAGFERLGSECSPYGFPLGISYQAESLDDLVKRGHHAMKEWERLDVEFRCAILCEAISKLHEKTFVFSHAGMHSSGHSFFMGFHANAIHAQARALESVAYIHALEPSLNQQIESDTQIGHGPIQRIARSFKPKPVGLALVYSGQIVPTWGAYAGMFASLAAGCPVIALPHRNAILPIALTVSTIKSVCERAGVSKDIVNLLCSDDSSDYRIAAQHPSVKIIDYTGKSSFANWLRQNASGAHVMTHESSFTPVVIHSTDDYDSMIENIAYGLCSYSAQLCTSPQNLYVLEDGIKTPEGTISAETFKSDLVEKVDALVDQSKNFHDLLGAVADPASLDNIERYSTGRFGRVLRHSRRLSNPDFDQARICSPLIVDVPYGECASCVGYDLEVTGPISFVISKRSMKEVRQDISQAAQNTGIINIGLFSMNPKVEAMFTYLASDIGALLSVNFTRNFYISQSLVFTDLHGNALKSTSSGIVGSLPFYMSRLRVTESRRISVPRDPED